MNAKEKAIEDFKWNGNFERAMKIYSEELTKKHIDDIRSYDEFDIGIVTLKEEDINNIEKEWLKK